MHTQYLCPCCTYSVPHRAQTCPVCGTLMQRVEPEAKKTPGRFTDSFNAAPFVP